MSKVNANRLLVGLTAGAFTAIAGLVYYYWKSKKKRQKAIEDDLKGNNSPRKKTQRLIATETGPPPSTGRQKQATSVETGSNGVKNQVEIPDSPPLPTFGLQSEIQAKFSEIKILKDDVSYLIGKGGQNIKRIQRDTNTRISSKGDPLDNGDRVYVITGIPSDVEMAEFQIKRHLMSQPLLLTTEICVPDHMLGRIIGRGGEMIKGIQDMSGARIDIPRQEAETSFDVPENVLKGRGGQNLRVVRVRGTDEQIADATRKIQAIVNEDFTLRSRILDTTAARTRRTPKPTPSSATRKEKENQEPEVIPISRNDVSLNLRSDGTMDVYVSCVYHPNSFWIQICGKDSIELDRLVQQMTEFYKYQSKPKPDEEEIFRVKDLVAAVFDVDGKMYRARVMEIKGDEVEVFFIDYGDKRVVKKDVLRPMNPEFLRLPQQAMEGTLNLKHIGDGDRWSDEAIALFCELSDVGQWSNILRAKVIGYLRDPVEVIKDFTEANNDFTEVSMDPLGLPNLLWMELYDTQRLNVGDELIRRGLAVPLPEPSPSSVSSEEVRLEQEPSQEQADSASNNANNNSASSNGNSPVITYASVASAGVPDLQ